METKDWNNVSIDELPDLSVRASNYLKNLGVKTVGELISLKTLGNPDVCKETSIPKDEIIEAVRKLGLSMKCK